jgi:FMN phosphatase YigB (HAD superfamily)
MYVQKDKVILTDCDGVLFDWEYAFDTWMHRHGYRVKVPDVYKVRTKYDLKAGEADRLVMMFNESARIRRLPPHRDAIKYIRKLHDEHGYVFHVITSLTDDEYSQHLRTKNLRELFGDTIFERYVYLDCGADKDKALAEYGGSGCYWIEDKLHNAVVGSTLGLESMLMAHNHNADYTGDIPRVQDWKEIYYKIIDQNY